MAWHVWLYDNSLLSSCSQLQMVSDVVLDVCAIHLYKREFVLIVQNQTQ